MDVVVVVVFVMGPETALKHIDLIYSETCFRKLRMLTEARCWGRCHGNKFWD